MIFRRSPLSELEPAQRALAQGRYEVAFALLENAARRPAGRSTQAVLWLHLAAAYALYGLDGVDNGLVVLRSAVHADPNIAQHALYCALFWEFAAYRGDPVGDVKRGVKAVIGGDDPIARYHAGSALVAAGAPKTAARTLSGLGDADLPTHLVWRRWSLLGQAYEQLGDWPGAAEAFGVSARLAGGAEREAERLSLASCQLELGDAAEAKSTLDVIDESLLSQEERAVKCYLEGRANVDLGNPNRALELFTEARALEDPAEEPSFSLLFATGQCLASLGRTREAEWELERAVAHAPLEHLPFARHEYAFALIESERLDDARDTLEEVLGDPGYPHRAETFSDLADVLFRMGQFDEAEVVARQALELGATAAACLTLGSIAYDYFRLDEAVSWYEQTISASRPGEPSWVNAQQLLADVFAQQGEEAVERLLRHASAALMYTDPGSDWFLPLQRYCDQAQDWLGGNTRLFN